MKRKTLSKAAIPAAICAGLFITGGAVESQAQLTPGQRNQIEKFFGNRAEIGIVLGASDAASSGTYSIDGEDGQDDTEYSLMKFGGGGEIGEPRRFGDGDMTWNPVLFGSVANMSGGNDITRGALSGNELKESALGLHLGVGAAMHVTERFTITPRIGALYGRYDVDLNARNAAGNAAQRVIDDESDVMGATPGITLAYAIPMGKSTLELSGGYTYFGTWDISSSEWDMGGDSHVLEQRADIDIPLNAHLWDCQLHTGGYVSLTEALGDLEDAMRSDVWLTIHPRILLDTTGKSWAWKMAGIGLGASAILADEFTGYDVGVEVNFKF